MRQGLENETVWLTQAQMADLFQRERSVITKHIRNIFEEGELVEEAVCANDARTAADGKTYQTAAYNLDVIISNRIEETLHESFQRTLGKSVGASEQLLVFHSNEFRIELFQIQRA